MAARTDRSTRVLFLAPAPPAPGEGGGALRMFHLLRFLGERYAVDLIAPAGPGAEEAERLCKPYCADIELVPPSPASRLLPSLRLGPYAIDPALRTAVRRRLRDTGYAAIQVEKPAMLPALPREPRPPLVLDTWAYGLAGPRRALRHERGPLTRARNLLRLARFAWFDACCWPVTWCILVVSEADRLRCQRARPGRRVLVVPNGVDCRAFLPRPADVPARAPRAPTILFTGDMSFAPNVEAARLLATRVFPRIREQVPDARLRLAGRAPAPAVRTLAGPAITVTGAVPDMAEELGAATVYVAPHFTGAGTRTKLLEAMAMGLPIVTTTIGLEGLEARPDEEVLIADDVDGLAAAGLALLAQPARRACLGAAARRLAERRYDWARCLQPLEDLYGELARGGEGAC